MPNYGLMREVSLPFDTVLKKLPIELRKKSFEIISNVRMDTELHKHIGVDFKRYAILGVCNFPLSYKALMRDDLFGLILTCNIIVYEKEKYTGVGVIRPSVFTPLLENEYLNEGANTIEKKLLEVLETLGKKRFLRERKKESTQTDTAIKAVA